MPIMALDFLVTSLSLSSTFLLLSGISLHFPKWEFEKKKKKESKGNYWQTQNLPEMAEEKEGQDSQR